MYDPQQEDIWESAIRAAESVYFPSGTPAPGRTAKAQRERGYEQAKSDILRALRQAQRESIARRYPLMK